MAVKYLEGKDSCQWCNKPMYRYDMERAKNFCCDDCRYKYHNAQKKIKREEQNAWRAISYIQSMMLKNGELGDESLKMIRQLMGHVKTITFECKCGECGQYHFFIPERGEKCDFCQAENWVFFQKKQYETSE